MTGVSLSRWTMSYFAAALAALLAAELLLLYENPIWLALLWALLCRSLTTRLPVSSRFLLGSAVLAMAAPVKVVVSPTWMS